MSWDQHLRSNHREWKRCPTFFLHFAQPRWNLKHFVYITHHNTLRYFGALGNSNRGFYWGCQPRQTDSRYEQNALPKYLLEMIETSNNKSRLARCSDSNRVEIIHIYTIYQHIHITRALHLSNGHTSEVSFSEWGCYPFSWPRAGVGISAGRDQPNITSSNLAAKAQESSRPIRRCAAIDVSGVAYKM